MTEVEYRSNDKSVTNSNNNMPLTTDYEGDVNIEEYRYSYHSQLSKINKDILTQEKVLEKYFGDRWNDMPQDRRDLLLDFLFVNDDVRGKYDSNSSGVQFSSSEVQESFPRLHINSGQKINVDFESDLWTWRDEHSGPFSWYSRSQQDLTLADLDAENITKPQPKSTQIDDDDQRLKNAADQFSYPSSMWCHDVIEEFKKHEDKIRISPSSDLILPTTQARLAKVKSEEFNQKADEETYDNITSTGHIDSDQVKKEEDPQPPAVNGLEMRSNSQGRRSRSPSPKSINRSGSLLRSSVKTSETNLINKQDEDSVCDNAFSNPAMESEWSNFVGESNRETSVSEPYTEDIRSGRDTYTAPQPLSMDRGGGQSMPSPYPGDRDRLIQPQSPLIHSAIMSGSPYSTPGSGESSPDHNTYLLKGMQAHSNPQYISEPVSRVRDQREEQKLDEVLQVETLGDSVMKMSFTTKESDSNRDSNIPETGYDFLDNW